jgi:hypothetical protein
MYERVKKGTEYELFSRDVIGGIKSTIVTEITNFLKSKKKPKKAILGAFALKNVPLLNGGKTNVWIEYNAQILPIGIDAGIHECIIYDEIPDIVLDRYNCVKKFIYNG